MRSVLDPRPSRTRLALLGLIAGLVVIRLVAGQVGSDEPGAVVTGDPVGSAIAQEQPESKAQEEGDTEPLARETKFTEEEVRVLSELRQRRQDLQTRRERLRKTEERLKILRDKVGEDLDRLERFRDQIQVALNKEEQLRTEKMDHLVKVYSNMNPEKAAERIDRMDAKTAVKLLSRMSGQSAGRILSFVDPDKANRISQDMTRMVDELD